MKKVSFIAIVAVLLAALAASGAMAMTLTSGSFKDGEAIPVQYANYSTEEGWNWEGAENISPNLSWDTVDGAVCYVVLMEDTWFRDNVSYSNYHGYFVVPNTCVSIEEGASDGTAGKTIPEALYDSGYMGPCPPTKKGVYEPEGKDAFGNHKYRFTVYACEESWNDIKSKASEDTAQAIEEYIKGASLGSATIYGNFGQTSDGSGSSGGCNAGFGILALLCAVPVFCRKKN